MQNLLNAIIIQSQQRMFLQIIAQINMLIYLVRNIIDLKMIENGDFGLQSQTFNPIDCFDFIFCTFQSQIDYLKITMAVHICKAPITQMSQIELFTGTSEKKELPRQLIGDCERLQRVLVNFTKIALDSGAVGHINFLVAYD